MSEDSQLVKAVADVTHPFQPQGKKSSNSLLEASLADRRHRDSVYLAVLARAVSCTDRQPIVGRCFAFIRKYLSRCPPTPHVCEQLLDGAAHITDTIGDLSEELSSSIQYVQRLLESLLVVLEEKMGGKSSKLGPDDDTRLDKLRKRRLTASKGCSGSVNVIPTNVQDSPYLQRATNDGALGGPRVLGAPQEAHMSTSPVPRTPEVLVGVPTRHSAVPASPCNDTSSSGEAGGNMSATINLLAHRWQLHPPPKPGTARADAVAVLAAWPQLLAHSGRKLFRNRDDVVAAHETAPRWHMRGDFRSAADCAALVATDGVGAEHLRSIAQMQLQLAKQAGLRPRLGAAAAQEAASPFPANVRSLFSYKRYSEQEPLNITAAETAAAVALVLGPEAAAGLLGPSYSSMLVPDPAALSAGLVPGAQAVQVEKMASIVVKLIMDMWLQTDPAESFALMLPMLRGALAQQDPIYRVRAFDLVYNLALHAQMIEPVGGSTGGGSVGGSQDAALLRPPQRSYKRMQPCIVNVGDANRSRHGELGNGFEASLTRVDVFLQWLRCLLFQMLLEAVNLDDRSEALWRSALGCLLHLVSTGGQPNVECMAGLSNAPLAVLLQVAESHAWSFEVQGVLTCMACRLCYVHTENDEAPVATATTASASLSGGSTLSPNPLNRTQLAALGGVPAVFACLHRAVTERARDAALSVLLDAACARVARLDPSSEAYLRGRESHRVKSLLTSETARNAVALVAASADSIGDASATTTEAADAASSHVAEVGRANHPPTRAATSALHSLLCALAPTAADADGGVAWVASATHAVDACLGKDEFARNENRDALKSMMVAPDPITRRRVARILASLFWRGRSASVRDALKTFIQGPALYRAVPQKALAAISLLSPPPPPAPSSDPTLHVSTALSPLLDALAEQLSTPATASRGSALLLDIFHILLTTFLCRKGDIHAGLAGTTHSTTHHAFVTSATISFTVGWLQKLPDSSVSIPAMLNVICTMLDVLTVPVDDCFEEENVQQASGMLQTLPNSVRAHPRDADVPNDLLSPISHFLQGRSFMPSLVIMTLQPDCLLALLHALTPSPPSTSPSAPSRCERTGFAGWHSIPGAGAASGGSAADSGGGAAQPPPSEGGPGAGTSAVRPTYGGLAGGPHGESRVDTGVREGLTVGHASVRDARLAVYIILLVKYRLDGAALEAGGGCKELSKALQDEDVRVRHVVAEFILERAQRHRAADHQAVLATRLVPIAQTSSRASLVDNPYIQLQAVLASDLLSIDDL